MCQYESRRITRLAKEKRTKYVFLVVSSLGDNTQLNRRNPAAGDP
jgi:hypothetical protein